jgi:putative addiction module killer protein
MVIRKTCIFADWLDGLRDERAFARIVDRINRLASGNPGDVKPVGEGISEMRINYGQGYRVYFLQRKDVVIVLLNGGDKSSQSYDIMKAKRLAREWNNAS